MEVNCVYNIVAVFVLQLLTCLASFQTATSLPQNQSNPYAYVGPMLSSGEKTIEADGGDDLMPNQTVPANGPKETIKSSIPQSSSNAQKETRRLASASKQGNLRSATSDVQKASPIPMMSLEDSSSELNDRKFVPVTSQSIDDPDATKNRADDVTKIESENDTQQKAMQPSKTQNDTNEAFTLAEQTTERRNDTNDAFTLAEQQKKTANTTDNMQRSSGSGINASLEEKSFSSNNRSQGNKSKTSASASVPFRQLVNINEGNNAATQQRKLQPLSSRKEVQAGVEQTKSPQGLLSGENSSDEEAAVAAAAASDVQLSPKQLLTRRRNDEQLSSKSNQLEIEQTQFNAKADDATMIVDPEANGFDDDDKQANDVVDDKIRLVNMSGTAGLLQSNDDENMTKDLLANNVTSSRIDMNEARDFGQTNNISSNDASVDQMNTSPEADAAGQRSLVITANKGENVSAKSLPISKEWQNKSSKAAGSSKPWNQIESQSQEKESDDVTVNATMADDGVSNVTKPRRARFRFGIVDFNNDDDVDGLKPSLIGTDSSEDSSMTSNVSDEFEATMEELNLSDARKKTNQPNVFDSLAFASNEKEDPSEVSSSEEEGPGEVFLSEEQGPGEVSSSEDNISPINFVPRVDNKESTSSTSKVGSKVKLDEEEWNSGAMQCKGIECSSGEQTNQPNDSDSTALPNEEEGLDEVSSSENDVSSINLVPSKDNKETPSLTSKVGNKLDEEEWTLSSSREQTNRPNNLDSAVLSSEEDGPGEVSSSEDDISSINFVSKINKEEKTSLTSNVGNEVKVDERVVTFNSSGEKTNQPNDFNSVALSKSDVKQPEDFTFFSKIPIRDNKVFSSLTSNSANEVKVEEGVFTFNSSRANTNQPNHLDSVESSLSEEERPDENTSIQNVSRIDNNETTSLTSNAGNNLDEEEWTFSNSKEITNQSNDLSSLTALSSEIDDNDDITSENNLPLRDSNGTSPPTSVVENKEKVIDEGLNFSNASAMSNQSNNLSSLLAATVAKVGLGNSTGISLTPSKANKDTSSQPTKFGSEVKDNKEVLNSPNTQRKNKKPSSTNSVAMSLNEKGSPDENMSIDKGHRENTKEMGTLTSISDKDVGFAEERLNSSNIKENTGQSNGPESLPNPPNEKISPGGKPFKNPTPKDGIPSELPNDNKKTSGEDSYKRTNHYQSEQHSITGSLAPKIEVNTKEYSVSLNETKGNITNPIKTSSNVKENHKSNINEPSYLRPRLVSEKSVSGLIKSKQQGSNDKEYVKQTLHLDNQEPVKVKISSNVKANTELNNVKASYSRPRPGNEKSVTGSIKSKQQGSNDRGYVKQTLHLDNQEPVKLTLSSNVKANTELNNLKASYSRPRPEDEMPAISSMKYKEPGSNEEGYVEQTLHLDSQEPMKSLELRKNRQWIEFGLDTLKGIKRGKKRRFEDDKRKRNKWVVENYGKQTIIVLS